MDLAPDVKRTLAGLYARRQRYASYQAWYDGEFNLRRLLDRLPIRNESFKDALCELSENLCPLVVDTLADRLQLQGFDAPGVENAAADLLKRWRIDAFQGEVHRRTATQGDGYILVWADRGEQPFAWFHDGAEMAVERSDRDPSSLALALKEWIDEQNRQRLTIYRPDRVERFYKKAKAVPPVIGIVRNAWSSISGAPQDHRAWEPFDEGGPAVFRNELGIVPVAVFNNGRYRHLGYSELRDVVGPQRMLNKSLVDLALASEASGVSNRWVLGLDFNIDPKTGKPAHGFDPKDPIWAFAGDKEKMALGQFTASDLNNLAEGSVKTYRSTIARVSRTPQHYLGEETGTWPSGESLKTAEAPFSQKVDARQVQYGEPWEDAVRIALMFQGQATKDTRLEAKWKDTRPRHELEYWQGQQIQHELGKSKREIWVEEGFSEAEITKMLEQGASEAKTAAENSESVMSRMFASGGQVPE